MPLTIETRDEDALTWYMVEGKDCQISLEAHPHYCDRGNWIAKLHYSDRSKLALEIDQSDGWPRYYFDWDRMLAEVEAWLIKRGQMPMLPAAQSRSTAAQLLRASLEILETKQWAQGAAAWFDGNTCAGLALGCAKDNLDSTYEVLIEAMTFLNLPEGQKRITRWNDQPGQTKENVLATFRAAIERAESSTEA